MTTITKIDDIIIYSPTKARVKPLKSIEFDDFVEIVSADNSFKVGLPVALRCPLFKSMLNSSLSEALTKKISLKNYASDAVEKVIQV